MARKAKDVSMIGAGRGGPQPAPVKSPSVAPPPRSPKPAGRIGNLGDFAHPAKKKRR